MFSGLTSRWAKPWSWMYAGASTTWRSTASRCESLSSLLSRAPDKGAPADVVHREPKDLRGEILEHAIAAADRRMDELSGAGAPPRALAPCRQEDTLSITASSTRGAPRRSTRLLSRRPVGVVCSWRGWHDEATSRATPGRPLATSRSCCPDPSREPRARRLGVAPSRSRAHPRWPASPHGPSRRGTACPSRRGSADELRRCRVVWVSCSGGHRAPCASTTKSDSITDQVCGDGSRASSA
jgi:hypothetical protein